MIRVRLADRGDIPAIVTMQRALARHQGDPDDLFTAEVAARDLFGERALAEAFLAEAFLAEAFLSDAALARNATKPPAPVGLALITPAYEPNHAARGLYLASLWVEPDARRQGIARALLAAVAAHAKARGDHYVWWTSKVWNEDAHRFYATLESVSEDLRAHAVFAEAFDAIASEAATAARPK